jgi:hypothetical protein
MQYKDVLTELEEVSKSLGDESEKMNEYFNIIEAKLADITPGVAGWSENIIRIKGANDRCYKLGFCKYENTWRLVCRLINEDGSICEVNKRNKYKKKYGNNPPWRNTIGLGLLIPVVTMPRFIRVQAAGLIGEVVEDLLQNSRDFLESTYAANKQLEIQLGTIKETIH